MKPGAWTGWTANCGICPLLTSQTEAGMTHRGGVMRSWQWSSSIKQIKATTHCLVVLPRSFPKSMHDYSDYSHFKAALKTPIHNPFSTIHIKSTKLAHCDSLNNESILSVGHVTKNGPRLCCYATSAWHAYMQRMAGGCGTLWKHTCVEDNLSG